MGLCQHRVGTPLLGLRQEGVGAATGQNLHVSRHGYVCPFRDFGGVGQWLIQRGQRLGQHFAGDPVRCQRVGDGDPRQHRFVRGQRLRGALVGLLGLPFCVLLPGQLCGDVAALGFEVVQMLAGGMDLGFVRGAADGGFQFGDGLGGCVGFGQIALVVGDRALQQVQGFFVLGQPGKIVLCALCQRCSMHQHAILEHEHGAAVGARQRVLRVCRAFQHRDLGLPLLEFGLVPHQLVGDAGVYRLAFSRRSASRCAASAWRLWSACNAPMR